MRIEYQDFGGQILAIGDIFYLSPIVIDENLPRRGGIPIIFPQFSNQGALSKHGFARNRLWSLQSIEEGGRRGLTYRLDILSEDISSWPYSALLELKLTLVNREILLEMNIQNTGTSQFSWTGGFHPYFRVDNLLESWIEGLNDGCTAGLHLRSSNHMDVERHYFSNNGCEVLFPNCSSLRLVMPHKTLNIESEGFDEWMVWNPGKAISRSISDLPDDDWLRFVCIEPVTVTTPIRLGVGQKFRGSLKISF